ncbi:hypothetical protein OG800_22545 [Streptomyces sp. NBC_00445]|uniref:hypothetical protein n=1 Tax=unclassified Streptomyces TaxID=2593676 RepID=UPI002E1B7F33|nr:MULTISPECIES: hypothetical protein [unclassified Streptomyces]
MSARLAADRTRLLATTTAVLAALVLAGALTGCEDGEGLRDEGPSATTSSTTSSTPPPASPAPTTDQTH